MVGMRAKDLGGKEWQGMASDRPSVETPTANNPELIWSVTTVTTGKRKQELWKQPASPYRAAERVREP